MDLVEHLKWVREHKVLGGKELCTFSTVEGWNSWNHFHCTINETVIRQTADAIVASGLAAAGYQYGLFYFGYEI